MRVPYNSFSLLNGEKLINLFACVSTGFPPDGDHFFAAQSRSSILKYDHHFKTKKSCGSMKYMSTPCFASSYAMSSPLIIVCPGTQIRDTLVLW